jgi:hypothetical protein
MMSHAALQLPPTQIWPAPQAVPSLALDHVVVELAGVQISQALPGFWAPAM